MEILLQVDLVILSLGNLIKLKVVHCLETFSKFGYNYKNLIAKQVTQILDITVKIVSCWLICLKRR